MDVNETRLEQLIRHRKNATREIAEVRGEYAADAKGFINDHGMNNVGHGMIMRLSGMAPEKALDALRTFDALRPHLDAYLGKQNDFFEDGPEAQDEAAAADAEDDDPLADLDDLDPPEDEDRRPRLVEHDAEENAA